ncbi:putative ATP-binding protein PRP16 [Fusarium bulbicola]|nr:putative ATP-binding protein PRP16 [Fusarium bulbicola]
MELTTICLTALIIGFLLIGNSPIQMPREAWGYTLATVFFAVIGGASFFGQIIHTALPALRKTHDTPEDYFEHIAKVLYHGRVKFSAPDHHFNREFGICCDQEGHCISCLDLQDEEYGEIQAFLRMLHNSPVTAGTCQALAQMPAICPNKASNIRNVKKPTSQSHSSKITTPTPTPTHHNHNNDFRIRMNSLERNKTTAEQARMLEDAPNHPLRPGVPRPAEYFKILQSRRKLPVSAMHQEFLDVYHKSKRYLKVVVLMGETGSGKTTQVPQFVWYDEYASGKIVACTQPRRLAATSVASRVADEMGVTLGEEVGYSVRFDDKFRSDKSRAHTRLQYVMTDGLLLQGALKDTNLSEYVSDIAGKSVCSDVADNYQACIIIDEAHERTKATDILMALLKAAVQKRDDLKVVIMSATMDAGKFVEYFGVGQPFNVPGRPHAVDVYYLEKATPDWMVSALHTAKHVTYNMPPGDILLFVPTIDNVVECCKRLNEKLANRLHALPLHAALSRSEQAKALSQGTTGTRRCIVATNVAETSLTIDGIVYVIDTGIEMHSSYNPRGDMETLDNAEISKAAARQRAGRAGRTRSGVCFRLCTKEAFDEDFAPGKTPGILSSSISQEVLQLMYMGNHNVARFDFIDPPDTEVYLRALHELNAMGYINDNAKITHVGKMAAQIPVHPVWYNAIVEGQKLGCGVEMVALAALGSTQDPVLLHPPRVAVARVAHSRFTCPNSDHITNLHALHAYVRTKIQGNIDMAQWCFDAFIDQRVMEEVLQIREQLKAKVQNILGQPLTSALFDDGYELKIRKALARSLHTNSAIEKGEDVYMTVHDAVPAIVPLTSALFKQAIDPEWLADLPFFQDDKLSVKRDEARTIRQPYVKESLNAARARLQSSDTAANSSLCTLTRQAGPKPAPEPMGLDKERQAQAPQGADTVKDALPLVSGALASMALTKFPGDWYHVPMKPDLPVSSFTSYMLKVEGLYKAAGVVARPVISINGPGILHSTPVSSPAPQNNPFYTSGCQKDDRRPPRHQDVLNHDAPYKDTAHLFSSPIKMHKLCSGVDLQPGQLLGRDPEARSPMSQSTTFVKPSELSASTSSATCRAHMMKYSTPSIVGPDWGDHSRFRQWQLHGRAIKPDMVPNKTWDTTIGSSLEFILDGDAPGAAQKITVDGVGPAKFGIFRDIAPRSVADAMNRKTTAAEKRSKHQKETPQDKINKQTGSSRDW